MSKSMSTMIDDLPGVEDIENNYENNIEGNYRDDRTSQMANMNNNVNVNLNRNLDDSMPKHNITANIHKKSKDKLEKVENKDGLYDTVISYINKENVLLLVIVYIATLRQSDEYTRKFLLNLPFNLANNSNMSTIIKCLILVVIYLVIKHYI